MGKHKYIETPEKLWEYFVSYVEWAKSNPREKEDYVGKDAVRVMRKLERPLSWVGFEVFLYENAIISHLGSYEQNKDGKYEEYLPIIAHIKKAIENDQLDGASVGQYNHNIISRLLGLAEATNVNIVSKPSWMENDLPTKD